MSNDNDPAAVRLERLIDRTLAEWGELRMSIPASDPAGLRAEGILLTLRRVFGR